MTTKELPELANPDGPTHLLRLFTVPVIVAYLHSLGYHGALIRLPEGAKVEVVTVGEIDIVEVKK